MNILLVQLAFLGDVILTTPIIKGLKELYPDSKLWFLTTPLASPLLKNDPNLEGVIAFKKRGEHRGLRGSFRFAKELNNYQFDLIISVHKSYRTSLLLSLIKSPLKVGFQQAKLPFAYNHKIKMVGEHAVQRFFSILQFHPEYSRIEPEMNLVINEDSKFLQAKYGIDRQYIVIAPGSVWATKRWPARYYQQVAKSLNERGFQIVALGSNEENELCELATEDCGLNLAGKLSLRESLAILKEAKALICNDSMLLHAASAFKVPTVAVFCATSPDFGFGPWRNRAITVEKQGLSCKPCSRHGSKQCPLRTDSCMVGLSSEQVLTAFDSLQV